MCSITIYIFKKLYKYSMIAVKLVNFCHTKSKLNGVQNNIFIVNER